VVPIACEPGYRTDTIGRYADGQFYALDISLSADHLTTLEDPF
jgi:hypothetical protein